MTPYADFTYFAVLLYVLVPTLVLGVIGRLSWRWVLGITAVMLAVQYGGTVRIGPVNPVRELWILVGYGIVEVAILKGFLALRARGASRPIFYGAIAFVLLPLIVAKFLPLVAPESKIGFLGISYVTFRALDVVFSIQDRLIAALPIGELAAFLFFFPAVSSGPIDRYRRFAGDWLRRRDRGEFLADVDAAIHRIFTGFLYKFVIAALLKRFWVDPVATSAGFSSTLAYMYGYSFYLFFDFAGYSAFAIGVSYLMGIHTPENFNRPFLASNIRDFWNRWHMTLSGWLRDHVYMRFVMAATKGRWFKNKYAASHIGVLLSMGLMGLWHGTAWYFLLYGVYHAALLTGHDIFTRWNQRRKVWGDGPLWNAAGVFVTFNCVCFGFLLFSGRLQAAPLEPNLKGQIEVADCHVMSGWVVDDTTPERRLTVDLYDGDRWIGTVEANQLRPELAEQWKTSGHHGFTFTVPASLHDKRFHLIRAKVAETDVYLDESPATLACDNPIVTIEGVGRTSCDAISGWVWDSGQPNTPLEVNVYDGLTRLATIKADAYRIGLVWWKGKGYHGFDFELPLAIRDGTRHMLHATVAGLEMPIDGTKVAISCRADATEVSRVAGSDYRADCDSVSGVAFDPRDPNGAVDVDVYDGPALLATVRTTSADRGAFSFRLPEALRDGRAHTLTAKVAGVALPPVGSATVACAVGNTGVRKTAAISGRSDVLRAEGH